MRNKEVFKTRISDVLLPLESGLSKKSPVALEKTRRKPKL
jgi:hypothetical protein